MTNIRLALSYAFGDLKRQKVRSILGVMGVMISVGLLAIVLFLADSISVTFVDYLSQDAGNQDIVITVRHYNGEPANRSSFFEYQEIIDKIEDTTSKIKDYIPRMQVDGIVNISEGFDTTELTNLEEYSTISGIDFDLENKKDFGSFIKPDTVNTELKLNSLALNHCAIYYGFNDVIKYKKGETIQIEMSLWHGDVELTHIVDLEIDEIFDYHLKWPSSYRYSNLIVVDIETLYNIFGEEEFEGRCNKLILTLKDGNEIYDSRDVEGSKRKLKEIAADINIAIGLEAYNVHLPKLEILGWSEFITMGITIIFVFVSIISMLIAGILINGILKTSVEERIREFGIFRTVGAYRGYNLGVVLLQGFLLVNFGTIIGIIVALLGTQYLIIPFTAQYLLGGVTAGTSVMFSFTWTSVFIAYGMGVGVGLLVSISPAIKVMRLQLIESIHPYRHEDTLYHLQKKSSVSYKLILIGIILAANGGFIYFVIPRLLISMNISLMAGTLIAVLLIFLIGLTLAGLGLMPIVLRFFILLFKPLSGRLHQVIRIFVFRYQRRNSSTVIIFALSFSFVMFTSTVITTQAAQISVMIRVRYGSDLVMETTGWAEEDDDGLFGGGGMDFDMGGGDGGGFFSIGTGQTSYVESGYSSTSLDNIRLSAESVINPSRLMTTNFEHELLNIEGIEKVSSVLASPNQLTQIYGAGEKKFEADIGDYAGLSSSSIELLGIDEEYQSTVDARWMVFTQGDQDEAFEELFHNEDDYTIIISESIAISLSLNLRDKIRITIARGDEVENYPFIIVGMASSMPGFAFEFSSSGSSFGGSKAGVLVSQKTYLEILDIPEPAWVNKIFIKLQENMLSSAREIEDEIDDKYQNDYDYNLFNTERMVARQEATFQIVNILFTLILMSTVIICLFGLLSSSYSTIIERKKEIGIVRTLGLRGNELNRMFIIEALIIMLASGTVGTLVGWLTGWLLSSNMNLFTDMPYQPQFPWLNFIIIYTVSVVFILIGMRRLLKKLRKKKITEIYRESL